MRKAIYVLGGFVSGLLASLLFGKSKCGGFGYCKNNDTGCNPGDDCCKVESGCCEPGDGCCQINDSCCAPEETKTPETVVDITPQSAPEKKTVKGKRVKTPKSE